MSSFYPFAHELITDSQGTIVKVILPVAEYLRLIETLEDEGLLRAMMETEAERALSWEEALCDLEKNENSV